MKGLVTKDTLKAQLQKLGIQPSCSVMLHASLSALGVVDGGSQTVVDALRAAVGDEGAVIVPSFRDAIRSEHYALQYCRNCRTQDLCPSREPGFTGIIGETFREQPDAVRSCHPTHSWVGIGQKAKTLLSGHRHSLTPCGNDSPFMRLMEADGLILLLGVGVNSLTNIHAVEDARNVPYLSAIDPPNRHATYTTSGKRLQYVYPNLLVSALKECGLVREGRTGACLSSVISARDFGAWLWTITEEDPWSLVLRPKTNTYEAFVDACEKIADMVRAWQGKGNADGWKHLLVAARKPREPILFEPCKIPQITCPAYAGELRSHPRCLANDLPPWEKFEDYPGQPGVATCDQCNWPNQKTDKKKACTL
jgi:aminoglycoside N3'-acetyltransferase